ncbi:MAG: DNA methyltransferase [Bacteroidales bacterium]|nr:DNA methyltransferase [Bacteroidales bacterium]
MDLQEYIKQINEQFKTGNAREHSYRPMLQQLLNDLLPGFVVTNEPARISCGAPDYIISSKREQMPVFYVEAKDINDSDLDGRNLHKEQFSRYKDSLGHIIFTDYLDFHLYENGEWIKNVRIGEIQGNNIRLLKSHVDEFNALISHIADTKPTPITSATKLAQQMAARARTLAQTIKKAFQLAEEDEDAAYKNQQLQSQLEAFRRVLINDLTPEGFADIYAQTVAYGMFAARLHDETPENFTRQEAANLIPKSNPFLRQIFQSIAGYDLDERIAWVVDDLVSIFLATDVEQVMKSYSSNGLHHDPMIHFYEDFLSAYDPALRKSKGVWYTPQPVVQFIVRAVDEILQKDFGLVDGLADCSMIEREVVNETYSKGKGGKKTIKKPMHRVQILDPATGTGTFLAEAVNQIYDKFRGMQGMWQGYVSDHLLPRLHGFEILMASYAVAHLKLDMLLKETGFVQSSSNLQRLKIYLTNSLEEFHQDTGTLWSSWLSNEANEANHIKRDCPVMVMMGNPPYSISSSNKGSWITKLVDDYKRGLNEQKINIEDDYIKFIRLGQHFIEKNTEGILAYISNNSFIDGITHRKMRFELMRNFDKIYILNLHGNVRETAPNRGKDENVFDIMQGVSINLFVRSPKHREKTCHIFFQEIWGTRSQKYDFLTSTSLDTIKWLEVKPSEPYFFFVPKDFNLQDDYKHGVKIDSLFRTGSTGIESQKDSFCIADSEIAIRHRINDILNKSIDDIRNKYNIEDGSAWTLENAVRAVKSEPCLDKFIRIAYFPFDDKYTYYLPKFLARTRAKALGVMRRDNLSLIVPRQCKNEWHHSFCSNIITNGNFLASAKLLGSGTQFPLFLYDPYTSEKIPNLNSEEWQKFNEAVGREITPEELLAYIYGVLYSPSYRELYMEFLKVDFPRVPLPESAAEFKRKATLGQQLIDLHLMKNTQVWKTITTFPEAGSQKVERSEWSEGKIWINSIQYFGNVPEAAWDFYIGGYQPAQKWLKDRKGYTLSFDDIKHYIFIIHALTETNRLMKEIG